MEQALKHRLVFVATAACVSATMVGCSEKLLRENVFASTATMVGVEISQNPQTQSYESRVGYARQELFLVPTYKAVAGRSSDANSNSDSKEDVSFYGPLERTPEVLAYIEGGRREGSESGPGKQEKGSGGVFVFRQRLAVGQLAVGSGAAKELFAEGNGPVSLLTEEELLAGAEARRNFIAAYNHAVEQEKQTTLQEFVNQNVDPTADQVRQAAIDAERVVEDKLDRMAGFYVAVYQASNDNPEALHRLTAYLHEQYPQAEPAEED